MALPSVGLCEGWGEVRGQGSQFLDGVMAGNRRRASAGLGAGARADRRDPHPGGHDRRAEGQVKPADLVPRRDPGEAGQEEDPGDCRIDSPAALALGGETASEDEAPSDQAQEADAARDQVAKAMPADGRGGPAGVPGGKPWAGSAVSRPAATRPAP
jgi:hypothetical protein